MLSVSSSMTPTADWVFVAGVDQVALGQGRCFLVGGRKVAIFRLRNGGVYALDAVCPHREGPLADGVVGHNAVVCPFHGYKFSLMDGHGLDNDFAVASYPVELRGSMLYIKLPQPA